MKEQWAVFYLGDKELSSYTLRGTFPGEAGATAELLAYENGVPVEAIRVAYEWRQLK